MSKEIGLNQQNHVDNLYEKAVSHINAAREAVRRTVDTEMVKAYWMIGQEIVEVEQSGSTRAKYGNAVLKQLSSKLQGRYKRGFGVDSLEQARKFYLTYQGVSGEHKSDAVRRKLKLPTFSPNLSWTHYRTLMRVKRVEARNFYEQEASANCWSARELQRQVGSLLFDRLAKSKDQAGLLALACKGQEISSAEDIIKDPLVLEFLGLPESQQLVESDLEQSLINHLQQFLLELGKGFSFVARQKRLSLDGDHFYADLVFYHVILKCYVIIDIKTKPLSHSDLGQIQLYVNYFDQEVKQSSDNPTIGLVLCTQKKDKMARYLLGDKAKQVFTSTYMLHLPSEEELSQELKREIREIQQDLSCSEI